MTNASRLRDTDRKTRVHLALFDRFKFLILFALTFLVLVWSDLANNPILSFSDSVINNFNSRWWLVILSILEVARQIHFLAAEFLEPYHGAWSSYFSFINRVIYRFGDWTRYRLSRAIKGLLWIALLAVVLGAIYKQSPVTEIGRAHV